MEKGRDEGIIKPVRWKTFEVCPGDGKWGAAIGGVRGETKGRHRIVAFPIPTYGQGGLRRRRERSDNAWEGSWFKLGQ